MPTNADVVSLQQEKVRSKLPELFETSDFLMSEVKRAAETENVSTRDYRIPILVSYGGDYRTFDPDGGDMGRGSGPLTKHYVASYFPTTQAIELTSLQMDATAKSEQATKKTFALALAGGMKSFQANEDAAFHTAGNGVIATATAQTGTPTVYTLETTQFSTQLLRRQMPVRVYDTTLGTHRTSGVTLANRRVAAIDIANSKVTLTSTIGSAAATDKLVFDGPDVTTPPWKKGIPVFLNSLTTGTLMSLDRATYPEIVSNWISANGALTGVHGMLLIDLIEQRRDNVGSLTASFHMKQRTAWYKVGMAISEWQRRGGNDAPLDIVPKRAREFQFAGIRAVTDKHGDRSVVYVFDFSRWGRTVLKDVDWHTKPGNAQKAFPLYGTSGGIAAGIIMYLELESDWYTDDPGCQGFIDGLTIPTA